jgi:cation transport regulator ChaB
MLKKIYNSISSLPDRVKNYFPESGQKEFMDIFNNVMKTQKDETIAFSITYAAMKKHGWTKGEDGKYIKVQKISCKTKVHKINDEKKQVFGWALVSHEWIGDGENLILKQVTDYQDDLVDEDDLEEMAYNFVKKYREGGEMHLKGGSATCIESFVSTLEKQKQLGIPEGTMPVGWLIGFQVTDDKAWQKIKSGEYEGFSIEGTGRRVNNE